MKSNNEMLDLAHLLAEEFEISIATEDQLQKVIDLVRGVPAQGTPEEQFCAWLSGYLGAKLGRDELNEFEANDIRSMLNRALAGHLVSPKFVGSLAEGEDEDSYDRGWKAGYEAAVTSRSPAASADQDDIVERLRDHGLFSKQERMKLFIEAADRIEALRRPSQPESAAEERRK